jgi:hypothetical protein
MLYPETAGTQHDVNVISNALKPLLDDDRDAILSKIIPWAAIEAERDDVDRLMPLDVEPDWVFFMEAIADHSALQKARYRILIPNPEWTDEETMRRAGLCTHVWHKSRGSMVRLAPAFPAARHSLIGFTSCDPLVTVRSHTSFLHARGSKYTNRNTNAVLRRWNARPDWPSLHVAFHGGDMAEVGLADFRPNRNIQLESRWLERNEYIDLVCDNGIHLCTSEVEGFGHYINEARAIGALVVTVDAPPMNEMVDAESGFLVKHRSKLPLNYGTRYLIDEDDLEATIDEILDLDPPSRRRLGDAARDRFHTEQRVFLRRFANTVAELRDSDAGALYQFRRSLRTIARAFASK